MTKILMVCLGNICRSPLAKVVMQTYLSSENFVVDSAGTIDFHRGKAADIRAITIASHYGLDLSLHRSRCIHPLDFKEFDHIYCMDNSNFIDIIAMAPEAYRYKVKMILPENEEVPDPYYGDLNDFNNVFQLLDRACAIEAEKIK